MIRLLIAICLMGSVAIPNSAIAVNLPNVFGDHMVLQRDKPVRLWGSAKPGEKLFIRFAGQSVNAVAGDDGQWSVTFKPMKASFDGRELVVEATSGKVVLADVLVGEVWMCGGQSNMEFVLRSSRNADVEIPSANSPGIRFLRIPHVARTEPQKDFPVEDTKGKWQLCMPPEVENCTAVGYYFAVRLRRRLNVPVGFIDTSWGGTMAQHWVPKDVLVKFPEMKPYIDDFDKALRTWKDGGGAPGAKRRYEADVKAWEVKNAEPKSKGERRPRRPKFKSYTSPADKHQPGGMYNGMIAPLAGLSLRGVLFYQGENNSFGESWKPFHRTFPAVISSWRKAFADENLPFGILQIPGWSSRRSMTYDMNHHTNIIREIQFLTWRRTPNTGLVVTFDTNTSQSIHPSHKAPVGERAARWALAEAYGVKGWHSSQPLQWQGPVYKSMAINDGKIIVTFQKGADHGLVLARGDDCGFYIAGKDRQFHHASARVVKDNKLEIWCEEVPQPVAARYGWSNLPAGWLMNNRGLPAYPFRTDTWPMTPHQSTGSYQVDVPEK